MPDQLPQITSVHEEFDFETLEDELRVDGQCRQLLQQFYDYLQGTGITTQRSSELAYAADYFVRDYQLDFLQQNILQPSSGQVRYFAASWYITRTLEPEMRVLEQYLDGIVAWYRFLRGLNLISDQLLSSLEQEALEREYYRSRIDRFLALAGDGYADWDRECPLPAVGGAL